ncbi:hypothetical protein E5288_WYG011943 [Bos mutus]|uniref:Uncharacterized protein n=1 Tax=Bos mutus TaxID=72004 RepID=A0A6B0QUR5_9CETA|nr:hypothetical protein [Bos mutus]
MSIICCPQAARWHRFVCFTAGLTGILLPDGEASAPRQWLQKLLRIRLWHGKERVLTRHVLFSDLLPLCFRCQDALFAH